jgi:hypothetical protein
MTEVSLYSSQSFQSNNGIGPQIRLQPPFMSFPILYSVIILSFEATLLRAYLNKLKMCNRTTNIHDISLLKEREEPYTYVV